MGERVPGSTITWFSYVSHDQRKQPHTSVLGQCWEAGGEVEVAFVPSHVYF